MSALAGATWPQVEDGLRRVLLIPLGALEQHGPHLPLGTDTTIAAAVAAGAAARCDGACVAPALPVGASDEHLGFPGTLSIGTEALTEMVVMLGRSAARTWRSMLFVNAHGGNAAALAAAVDRLRDEGVRCASHHASVVGGDAHAGHTETSIMLALDPDLVRMELAQAGERRPIGELMPALRREGVRAVSPGGVLGDPLGADAATGARMLEELVAACAAAVGRLADGEG